MDIRREPLLGCIVLLAVISLVGVIAAQAQNNVVPPTAVQAAKMRQFASRLAHPASRQTSTLAARRPSRAACSQTRPGSPQNEVIYENGPINGNTDAWTINFGYIVSDSFTVANGNTTVTGMSFGAWLSPGDTLTSAQISITSSPFGGTQYFNSVVNFTQSGCVTNNYGYDICLETSSAFNVPSLNSGTYWVNLQNASVPSGDPIYWDENSGAGCNSPGCPSQAEESSVGTIPSESFTILGSTTTTSTTSPPNNCIPEQSGNFAVIHDFTGNGDGGSPSGVTIDNAGNVYGPTQWGGSGFGTVYKLAQAGSSWLLNTLYNFLGGANGGSPNGVIVGLNDNLYGSAPGGIQNCNGAYCGLIFRLRPSPTACLTGSCSWTNNVLYSFTGPTDAWDGGNLASDQAGNLYGVSESGGAQQLGAVFELTPSVGGWTESILYSFPGGSAGARPTAILVGNDGNLYGLTGLGGANGAGVVFQLTPSSGGWTENVIYNVPPGDNYLPSNTLLQDSSGNLFGIYSFTNCCGGMFSGIFMLTPSNGQWIYTQLWQADTEEFDIEIVPNMTLDASGNLWGTIEASSGGCLGGAVEYAFIFEGARTNEGWQFSLPAGWFYTFWEPGGALAMDTHGNLYGTTEICGAYGQGAVWRLSGAQ